MGETGVVTMRRRTAVSLVARISIDCAQQWHRTHVVAHAPSSPVEDSVIAQRSGTTRSSTPLVLTANTPIARMNANRSTASLYHCWRIGQSGQVLIANDNHSNHG